MEDNLIKFESYFYGQMSMQDSSSFETELTSNTQLKEEYDLFLTIKKAASDVERDNLRHLLYDYEITSEISEDKSNDKKLAKIYTIIKWASSIAALFIIGVWGYNSTQTISPEQLFAQNFEIYERQQSRGGESTFPVLSNKEIKTPENMLLYATMKIEEGEEIEGISYLKKISDDSTFRDKKYWYLGLANLRLGKLAEAKKHFIHLQKISNYKKTEIEIILSELKL